MKQNNRQLFCRFLALTIIAAACPDARAGVLFDNFSNPYNQSHSVGGFGPLGNSFQTSSSPFTLNDAQFRVAYTGSGSTSTSATISLYGSTSNSAGYIVDPSANKAPGVLGTLIETLGTIQTSDLTTSFSVVDLNAFSPVLLDANTYYWIVMQTSNSAPIAWQYAYDDSGTGTQGQDYLDYVNYIYPNSYGPFMMQLSGTSAAVPEPSSFVLLGLGGLGLAFSAYQRRRSV